MKRDRALLKRLIVEIGRSAGPYTGRLTADGYTVEQIEHQVLWMIEGGLVDGQIIEESDGDACVVAGLTKTGRELFKKLARKAA